MPARAVGGIELWVRIRATFGTPARAGTAMSSRQSSTSRLHSTDKNCQRDLALTTMMLPTRHPYAYLIGIGIRIRLHNSYDYQK